MKTKTFDISNFVTKSEPESTVLDTVKVTVLVHQK